MSHQRYVFIMLCLFLSTVASLLVIAIKASAAEAYPRDCTLGSASNGRIAAANLTVDRTTCRVGRKVVRYWLTGRATRNRWRCFYVDEGYDFDRLLCIKSGAFVEFTAAPVGAWD